MSQGRLLSLPVLFTIYTNVHQINNNVVKLLKFADDSCILGLLSNDSDDLIYKEAINNFTSWCSDNKLFLNADKTKEVIIDFRIKPSPILPVVINNQIIEQVNSYKYLGITIDNKLNWDLQANSVTKKINKRMFFLRKLCKFNVDSKLLNLFYTSIIESIICFCLIAWGGNTSTVSKNKINRTIKRASKIANHNFSFVDSLLTSLCSKKINKIFNTDHPLANFIKTSVRTGRPLYIKTRTERHRKSFLPYSIQFIDFKR